MEIPFLYQRQLLLFFILSTHYLFNYFYKINLYYYIYVLLLLFTISSFHHCITMTTNNQSLPNKKLGENGKKITTGQ